MKKIFLGILIGFGLSLATIVGASNTVQTYLFPSKVTINGVTQPLTGDYTVLNYEGHVYLPARYLAENIGGYIEYDPMAKEVKINYIQDSNQLLTDQVFPKFHVSVTSLELIGGRTKVSGVVSVDPADGGNPQSHVVRYALNFYNSNKQLTGTLLGGSEDKDIKDGEIRAFTGWVDGDVTKYASIELDTGVFDHTKKPVLK